MIIILLMLMMVTPLRSEAENLKLLRIGTGGQTGVYYPIGKIIAQGLTGTQSIQGHFPVRRQSLGNHVRHHRSQTGGGGFAGK